MLKKIMFNKDLIHGDYPKINFQDDINNYMADTLANMYDECFLEANSQAHRMGHRYILISETPDFVHDYNYTSNNINYTLKYTTLDNVCIVPEGFMLIDLHNNCRVIVELEEES